MLVMEAEKKRKKRKKKVQFFHAKTKIANLGKFFFYSWSISKKLLSHEVSEIENYTSVNGQSSSEIGCENLTIRYGFSAASKSLIE